jgi:RNA polymerase sigma-70 factor (sigma-E family)
MMHTMTGHRDPVGAGAAPTFDEYADAVWPALYRYAYLLAGNHADAEDLAQQTLEKALSNWRRVRTADRPEAYLRRILTNTYISSVRPKSRRLELLTDSPPERGGVPPGIEERASMWPLIVALPPRQRTVVVLRYYEDLSEHEIAEVMGCSAGNVKSTAHHALKALRAALGDEDESPEGRGR